MVHLLSYASNCCSNIRFNRFNRLDTAMVMESLFIASLLCTSICQTLATPTNGHHQKRADATFDYVIVGGGTAGLVVAERLSQNANLQIAVVEAGSYYEIANPLLSSTPAGDVFWAGSSPADKNPLVDWSFVTQPQAGANGRSIHYPRGKCLGGSSARNFMIYQRGTVGSYQMWADQVGDQSYTWANLLPYFKKSVKFTPPASSRAPNASAEYAASAFDAAGGPLRVSYANYAGPFSSYMEDSLNEIGIADAQDFNSGSLMGAQYCSSTIDPSSAKRDSSQTSFLNAARSRSNLKVYTITQAKRILFDGKRATGVRVTTAGIPYTITARKEVILSAGAFQSPQLLMVSGVGPLATLQQFNIPVVSALAGVGQNMWDHVFFGPAYRVKVQTFTRLANDLAYVLSQFAFDYSIRKRGPLTNPVCDYLGWEKVPASLRNQFSASTTSDLSQFSDDWPELEFLSAPGYVGDFSSLPLIQPKDGYQYATIMAALVAPLSRGNVTIKSTNTDDLPLINPNWLTSPTDQQVAIAGYKRVRQAFASKAMQPVLADPVEYFPGPTVQTDAEILETIRNTVHTVYHASGTCKMGKADDASAVVDSAGRVFGTQGLRVVDTSIFPLLPPGHPQSTVYALAEKIAAGILAGN
jgi:choline dehydrogenase